MITPKGPARLHLDSLDGARAVLLLGHGAGGAITAPDLTAAAGAARAAAARRTVVQVAGDHRLRTDVGAVAGAVERWLLSILGPVASGERPPALHPARSSAPTSPCPHREARA